MPGRRDRTAEEVNSAQHRLAALPRHFHLRPERGLHQLPDGRLQHVIRHEGAFARRIEVLLRQEEAVLAAEVAGRARRLGEKVTPAPCHSP